MVRETTAVIDRNARMPLLQRMPDLTGRVPVTPRDLYFLVSLHRESSPEAADLFLRSAQALMSGARTMAGIYFDEAAACLGIEHQTEPSTAPTFC